MKRVKKAMEGNGGLHMDISKPGGYTLVWHDEFDGSVLDPARWQLLESMRGSEDTGLADESNPAVMRVEDSQLKLSAIRDKNVDDGGPHYTTCYSITTFDRMHFRYGFLEMRAKVPFKKGAWPSFWMKSATGKLAPRATMAYMVEVGVFEVFASKTTLASNIHKWYADGAHTQFPYAERIRYSFRDSTSLNEEYHLYGFEWTPDAMTMYVDSEPYMTFDLSRDFDAGGDMDGFHDPLFILLNNHLFTPYSRWSPGENALVDDTSAFPMDYWIDWIRLYQKPGLGDLYVVG